MQGMSERQYAVHVGLSRGAIQKAKAAERLVLCPDSSINAAASDARRAETTDLEDPQAARTEAEARSRGGGGRRRRHAALTGSGSPGVGGGTTFLQAKTANEVLKAQERRIRLKMLNGELIERARALALMFRLALEERDAWTFDVDGSGDRHGGFLGAFRGTGSKTGRVKTARRAAFQGMYSLATWSVRD